jgi:Spy/CpxP family protein refolding chaperone
MKKTLVLTVMLFGLFSLMFAQMHDCGQGPKAGNREQGRPNMMPKMQMRDHFRMMAKELDLTEDQMKVMEKNKLDTEKEIATLEAQLKIAQMEHHAAMKDHDYKKAKTHAAKMADVKKDIASKRIDLKEKHWNLLTKEQQEKWEELRFEHPDSEDCGEPMMKHRFRK